MALAQVRSFRRFELKFVIDEHQASRLAESLKPWTVPDPMADGAAYVIESLYYDSEDLRFYWEKIDGQRLRRKLRIRRYVTDDKEAGGRDPVFLEIKQRLDRITQKRRTQTTLADAVAFLNDGVRPSRHQDSVLDEIDVLTGRSRLLPTLVTGYERTAMIGTTNDAGLRITFDRDCYYRSREPNLFATSKEGPLLPPGWVIVEIKLNDSMPAWLGNLAAANGLSLTRISKYVQGIERASLAPRSVFFHDVAQPPPKSISPRLLPANSGGRQRQPARMQP